MEFKKNNFGEAKVIVEKVDLHNFLPPFTSTQKEINLEKVAVTKPKIPFEKTKDFENSDSSHLSNKLKSLELQKFSVFEKVDDMTISKQKCSTIKSLFSEISQKSLSNGISHLGSIPNLVHQEKHTIFGKSSQLASERKKFLTPCVHIKDFKLSTISNVHATCRNMQCVQCNSFISSLSTSLKDIKKHKTIRGTNQNSLYHKNTSHSMVQNNKAVTKSLELQKFSVFEKVDDMTISKQKCSTIKSLSSEISQKSLSNGISNFGSIPNPVHQEKHTIFGKSSQLANERKKFLAPCVHIKDFKLFTISNVHATCQNVQCVQCDSFISSLSTSLNDIKKHKTIGGTNQNSLYHKYTSHTMVQNNKAATKATISSKELKKIKKEKKVKHWQSAKLKYRCDAYKTLIEYLS
ncbi:uncharacterized protein LOC118204230 [Stegodyphus dumicola]|uniref:uncharacterized protein LOC118204230 n=1 Tax=Stegodyphus dumicola TaxID=202533 RepID=UPI0015AF19CA|nr:uncharacterized protein LOC118204230 [Stegodyphus dumicola]